MILDPIGVRDSFIDNSVLEPQERQDTASAQKARTQHICTNFRRQISAFDRETMKAQMLKGLVYLGKIGAASVILLGNAILGIAMDSLFARFSIDLRTKNPFLITIADHMSKLLLPIQIVGFAVSFPLLLSPHPLLRGACRLVALLFFAAAEEFLFREVLQNRILPYLAKGLQPGLAQQVEKYDVLISSVFFANAHILRDSSFRVGVFPHFVAGLGLGWITKHMDKTGVTSTVIHAFYNFLLEADPWLDIALTR